MFKVVLVPCTVKLPVTNKSSPMLTLPPIPAPPITTSAPVVVLVDVVVAAATRLPPDVVTPVVARLANPVM